MMIVIISGIITGQSQGAVTGDISCDLWLICCEAGSFAIEREFQGTADSVYPSVLVDLIQIQIKFNIVVVFNKPKNQDK